MTGTPCEVPLPNIVTIIFLGLSCMGNAFGNQTAKLAFLSKIMFHLMEFP
jgi:hypothetical protein